MGVVGHVDGSAPGCIINNKMWRIVSWDGGTVVWERCLLFELK